MICAICICLQYHNMLYSIYFKLNYIFTYKQYGGCDLVSQIVPNYSSSCFITVVRFRGVSGPKTKMPWEKKAKQMGDQSTVQVALFYCTAVV